MAPRPAAGFPVSISEPSSFASAASFFRLSLAEFNVQATCTFGADMTVDMVPEFVACHEDGLGTE
jgi:hypothetical protein